MYHRSVVKGPGLLLGLLAVLMPAHHASAATKAQARTSPTAAAALARAKAAGASIAPGRTVVRPNAGAAAQPRVTPGAAGPVRGPANQGAPTISTGRNLPARPPAGANIPDLRKPATVKPKVVDKAADQSWMPKNLRRPQWIKDMTTERVQALKSGQPPQPSHGGGAFDFNLDGAPSNEINPSFFPDDSAYYALSSNRFGLNLYPGEDNPPAFLGDSDYHIFLSTFGLDRMIVRLGVYDNFGEQFEPRIGRDRKLLVSAFLPAEHEAYDGSNVPDIPTCQDEDGNPISFDDPGLPVRVIAYSDDAIQNTLDGSTSNVDYTEVLTPAVYSCMSTPGEGEEAEPTIRPVLIPDASPVWYPDPSSRIVYFVSLRGYDAADPDTHYTSLWRWDTGAEESPGGPFGPSNPRRVLSIPGQSILFPAISPDGRYIAFTVADVSFETDETGEIEDIVWGFDVTADRLKEAFKARIHVAPVDASSVGSPVPATSFSYTDEETGEVRESRDIMPFWSPLGQLGFSTDRVDSDGDGFADTLAADPAEALWDIYTIPFPLNMQLLNETVPDTTGQRRTLGRYDEDDSNELRGSWGPVNTQASAYGGLQPFIIYQADDADSWDIWMTDLTVESAPNGNILIGLPTITGNPNLDDEARDHLLKTHRVGLPNDYVNIAVTVNPAYIAEDEDGNPDYARTRVIAVVKDPDPINPAYFFDQNWVTGDVNNGIPINIYTQLHAGIPIQLTEDDVDAFINYVDETGLEPRLTFGGIVELEAVDGQPGRFASDVFTPVEASDYLLDIIVIREIELPGGDVYSEGFYTDNIGGFSTAPFIPASRMLLVSDFMAGQKSIPFTTHTLLPTIWPVESYVTWRQRPFFTAEDTQRPIVSAAGPFDGSFGAQWATVGPLVEWQEAPELLENPDIRNPRLVVGGGGSLTSNPLSQVRSPFSNAYDLWRVQCREPILYDDLKDESGAVVQYGVMKNYLPYLTTQPGYPVQSNSRTQRIADRTIVWMAPYAGQLNGNGGENSTAGHGGINNWGMGTVANLKTQAEILKFMTPQPATQTTFARQAGRLSMSGATIATTLSGEGDSDNALLQRFNVAFESPWDPAVINGLESARDVLVHSRDGIGLNPIAYDMWAYSALPHVGGGLPIDIELAPYLVWVPFYEGQLMYGTERRTNPVPTWEDGAWNQLFISTVRATGTGQPIWHYGSAGQTQPPPNSGIAAVETKQAPSGSENTSPRKSLFFAFGLEGVNRYYYTEQNYVRSDVRTAKIFHNIYDYMTTGAFSGQVFVNNNTANTANVLVYAVDVFSMDKFGQIVGTALTDANGRYYMDGLDAGVYELFAYRTGTAVAVQNPVIQPIDIGINTTSGRDSVTPANLYLVTAQPGTLRGVITDTETGKPVEGVTVRIQDVQGTVTRTTTTNALGEYVFEGVQKGLYIVTVDEQEGTLDAGTEEAETHIFQQFTNVASPLAVNTDQFQNDPRGDTVFNFKLNRRPVPPEPATLEITVFDDSNDETNPGVGATVSIFEGSTDNLLAVLEDSPSPNPGLTGEDGKVTFRIKAGQVTVRVEYGAYRVQTRSLVVQPDEGNPLGKTSAAFRFGGVLHAFPPDVVLMASAPYSYAGTTGSPLRFSNVLGLTEAQLERAVVSFNSLNQDWVFYPNYPADTFQPGVGYGMKLPAEGRVMEAGTPVPATSGYYVVRANPGWNLIGNPFPGEIVWSKANVTGALKNVRFSLRDDPSQTMYDVGGSERIVTDNILTGDLLWGATATDAHGNGIYNGTYSHTHTTLKPWQSYWVRVAQPTLFYFPVTEAPAASSLIRLKAGAPAEGAATIVPRAADWGLDITATSGDLKDSGLGLGYGRAATNGVDAGLDIPKPSPMSASTPTLFTAFRQADGGYLATDLRPAGSNNWTFEVNTNLSAQNITLSWKPTGRLPARSTLFLVDIATGQRIDMGATSQYTFRSDKSGGIRGFRVELRGVPMVSPR